MQGLTSDLGQKLKSARERSGFTQKDIANALQIQQPTYSQYESGTRLPSLETFARLVKLLGTSADFMLFGGDEKSNIRFDDETLKVFAEFKDLHDKNRKLFVDMLQLLHKYDVL